MIASLVRVDPASDHVATFWFATERPLSYTAGQFVELRLMLPDGCSDNPRRWFTLSSSPTEPYIGITTKFCGQLSPYKAALRQLQPGDSAYVSDPLGDFVLPKDTRIPLVFVAGGIGITPFRSMLRWQHDTGTHYNVALIHAVEHEADLAFEDVLSTSQATVTTFVRTPSFNWHGRRGVPTASDILAATSDSTGSYFYISGPEKMVKATARTLQATGIRSDQIICDYFSGRIG